MLLWQICVAGNNKAYVGLHVNTRGCIETKKNVLLLMAFCGRTVWLNRS